MTSLSNANKKVVLFSWKKFVFFITLFFIFFFFLFPQKVLMKNIDNELESSPLTVKYLKDMVANDPDNLTLRASLATHELHMGDFENAKTLLSPYTKTFPTTKAQWKILLLYYQTIRNKAYSLPERSLVREKNERELKTMLPMLAQCPYLTDPEFISLASDALAYEQPKSATQFYKVAFERNNSYPASIYEKAGLSSFYANDYQESAQFYLLAMQHSNTLAQKRHFFIKAINNLQAGNLPNQALELAGKTIDGLNDDHETLLYLVEIALSANQPKIAEQYITQVLKLHHQK